MVHICFPINQEGGEKIELCQNCLQAIFQEFIDDMNDVQKQFMRDQSKKHALDISTLSLLPNEISE